MPTSAQQRRTVSSDSKRQDRQANKQQQQKKQQQQGYRKDNQNNPNDQCGSRHANTKGGSLASAAVMKHVPQPASFNLSRGITSVNIPLYHGGSSSNENNVNKAKSIQSIIKEKNSPTPKTSKSKSSPKKTKKKTEKKNNVTNADSGLPQTLVPLDKHGSDNRRNPAQKGGGIFQIYSGLDKAPAFHAPAKASVSDLSGKSTANILNTPGSLLEGRISDYAYFPPVSGNKPQFYLPTVPNQSPPPHELIMQGGGRKKQQSTRSKSKGAMPSNDPYNYKNLLNPQS